VKGVHPLERGSLRLVIGCKLSDWSRNELSREIITEGEHELHHDLIYRRKGIRKAESPGLIKIGSDLLHRNKICEDDLATVKKGTKCSAGTVRMMHAAKTSFGLTFQISTLESKVLDGSAIWRQALELDTTIRLPLYASRKKVACVSPLPQQFTWRVGSLADQYHALDRPT
jgi:hypothetical protein